LASPGKVRDGPACSRRSESGAGSRVRDLR
jgi:hypothetical protein